VIFIPKLVTCFCVVTQTYRIRPEPTSFFYTTSKTFWTGVVLQYLFFSFIFYYLTFLFLTARSTATGVCGANARGVPLQKGGLRKLRVSRVIRG
jgi:hypothetical protein